MGERALFTDIPPAPLRAGYGHALCENSEELAFGHTLKTTINFPGPGSAFGHRKPF